MHLYGATYTDYRTRCDELMEQGWRLAQLSVWRNRIT
jgi:hypothetical protein